MQNRVNQINKMVLHDYKSGCGHFKVGAAGDEMAALSSVIKPTEIF